MFDSHAVKEFCRLCGAYGERDLATVSRAFVTNIDEFDRSQELQLNRLLDRSDEFFKPFRDPLRGCFQLEGVFSESREEIHTGLLAWLLQRVTTEAVLEVLGVKGVAPVSWKMLREQPIDEGRLDLVLAADDEWRIVVEVKTREYAQEDLDKQLGYRRCVAKEHQGCRFVFLAADVLDDCTTFGFQPLLWSEVCLRLRQHRPRKLSTESALFCALIGILEQNLCKLGAKQASRTKTISHMEAWIKSNGQG